MPALFPSRDRGIICGKQAVIEKLASFLTSIINLIAKGIIMTIVCHPPSTGTILVLGFRISFADGRYSKIQLIGQFLLSKPAQKAMEPEQHHHGRNAARNIRIVILLSLANKEAVLHMRVSFP